MTEETGMTEVISIKFRNRGKAYDFDPAGLTAKEGDKVIVETSKGLEIGNVVRGNHEILSDRVVQPLRPVARLATEDDLRVEEACRRREREAYVIGKQKIEAHGLDMKLVDVECSFEGNKLLFFFSSDGRVDFRELVKDLAGVFRARIELRQIGVRDEARMLGGLGMCGRQFCCGSFMNEFAPVSTKMAKTQSMSLNPTKISGACGRLMCCLRYEQSAYEDLVKNVPKNGAFVETPDGYGNVTQVNVLRQTVKVKLDGPGDDSLHQYDADEVAAIPGGRPKDGSQPPHILVIKPKKEEEPEEETGWVIPERLISFSEEKETAEVQPEPAPAKRSGSRRRGKRGGGGGQEKEASKDHPQRGHAQKQQASKEVQNAPEKKNTQKKNPERAASEKNASPQKHRSKPQKNHEQGKTAPVKVQTPGEQKAKSHHNNRHRHRYRPRGENGAAPKQEE